MTQRLLHSLFVAAFTYVTLAGGCVSSGNADMTVTVLPASPIVFNAPFSIPDPNQADAIVTLTPPWFGARYKLKNNRTDGKSITLPAITLEIFSGSTSTTCVIANETGVLITLTAGSEQLLTDSSGADRTWYCDGLPAGTTGTGSGSSESKNTKFTVQMKLVGWYGDQNNPESRFEKKIKFTTE